MRLRGAFNDFRRVALFLLLLNVAAWGNGGEAQTIRIKLVNGRSGHPMADQCIDVWVGDRSKQNSGPLLKTQTDGDGIAALYLSNEATKTSQSQRLACGFSGIINPIVKYGDTVSVRAGYVLCEKRTPAYSWLAMMDFSTTELLQHGIVMGNTCGKVAASPQPGEIIIFVRPLTWWERFKT